METKAKIPSPALVLVLEVLSENPGYGWLTVRQVTNVVRHFRYRTINHFLLGLAKEGVAERRAFFPGYRYRLSPSAANKPLYHQLRALGKGMCIITEQLAKGIAKINELEGGNWLGS